MKIENEEEYNAFLKVLHFFMNSEPNSKEEAVLDVLADLVVEYEKEHFSI